MMTAWPTPDQYGEQLALERAQARKDDSFNQAAGQIQKPSKGKYRIYRTMAIVLDILDLLELTGYGLIISYILKIIFAPILFLYSSGANSRIKNMHRLASTLQAQAEQLRRRAYTYANRYRFASRIAGKTKLGAKAVGRLETFVAGQGRKLTTTLRNPAFKNGVLIALDFIPLLDLAPWRTIGVILTYYDEKKTHQETQPAITEYQSAKAQANQADQTETGVAEESDYAA